MRRNLASTQAPFNAVQSNARRVAAHAGLGYSSITRGPGLQVRVAGGIQLDAQEALQLRPGSSVAAGDLVIDRQGGGRVAVGSTSLDTSGVSAPVLSTQIRGARRSVAVELATARSEASAAQDAADGAQETATNARTRAINAQSTADDARSRAINAQSDANAAQTTANGAASAASSAQNTANTALTKVSGLGTAQPNVGGWRTCLYNPSTGQFAYFAQG